MPLHDTHVQAEVRSDRRERLKTLIMDALTADCLSPAAASKLRGKLGFYSSLLAGKLGRGMMGPLIRRQYRFRGTNLSPELKRNLVWWYSALGNLRPRTAPSKQKKPIGAHTDAQGFGHIAAVYVSSPRRMVHVHLPRRFCEMAEKTEGGSPIFLYELCASILMVYIANSDHVTEARTCVLCVDNLAAVTALIKGSSSSPLAQVLVNLFRNIAAHGNTRWWAEYVNTKSNVADYPSRQCNAPEGGDCMSNEGVIPPNFLKAFESWNNLHRETTLFTTKK